MQQTEQLHNIPFLFDVGFQKGQEPSEANPNGGFTEIKALYDINGNSPDKAGSGPQQGQQGQPPAMPPQNMPPQNSGPANGGGGWPGQGQPAQPPAQGGWTPPAQQGQQPP